jgi:hypothetical protein
LGTPADGLGAAGAAVAAGRRGVRRTRSRTSVRRPPRRRGSRKLGSADARCNDGTAAGAASGGRPDAGTEAWNRPAGLGAEEAAAIANATRNATTSIAANSQRSADLLGPTDPRRRNITPGRMA